MSRTSIKCPQCGWTSHNPNDIAEEYCGNCHQYHDTMEASRVIYPQASTLLIESATFQSDVVCVSSPDAREWLKRNRHNRPQIKAAIDRYRNEMEMGRWHLNGEAIKFATDGTLLDGQNRLVALSTTSVPMAIPLLVVRGLEPETQKAMDQGVRRSTAQQLAMEGVPNAAVISAAVRWYLIQTNGLMFIDNKQQGVLITTPLIVDWIDGNIGRVHRLSELVPLFRKTGLRSASLGCFVLMVQDKQPEALTAFVALLANLSMLGNDDPIMALNRRIRRAKDQGMIFREREQLACVISAWNSWVRGQKVQKIQLGKGGLTADNFPEPHLRSIKVAEEEIDRGLEIYFKERRG